MISKELNNLQLVLFKSPVVAMVMYMTKEYYASEMANF